MSAARLAFVALQTLWGVAIVYVASILLTAGLVSLFEGWAYSDAVWWSFVTATTVGYGDLSPATAAGRIIALVVMHLGPGFIFPLATAIIASKLIVDHDTFSHDEQEEIKALLREIKDRL